MQLILWRHADAEDGMPDSERKLTGKGVKQARQVAAWLKERLPPRYVVLASPARRARQTAQALTRRFDIVEDVGTAATARQVLKAAGWPGADGAVVVVGHQPTLGQAAALVLAGADHGWSVRKGGLWWFDSRDGDVIVRAVIAPDML